MPVLSSRPPRRPRRPPSLQSLFAQLGCYLRWRDVVRLLGGHYPSVVAHTGSCAAPVGLSPPSAFGLVWRVLAGCNQSLLPAAASRRYSENRSLDAGPHTPAARRVLAPVSSTASSAFPTEECGSASRVCPRMTISRGVTFRGCRYSVMFRPPSLLAPRIVPTAASTAAGQLGLLHPGISCSVASARSGYANRPNTGNWRYEDLHLARLSALSAAPLPLSHRPSPQHPWVGCTTMLRSTTSERAVLSRLQSFDNLQASEFAATQVVPTAVNLSDARAAVALHPSKSRFVTSPRIGYASRLNRAIDGRGLSPPSSPPAMADLQRMKRCYAAAAPSAKRSAYLGAVKPVS